MGAVTNPVPERKKRIMAAPRFTAQHRNAGIIQFAFWDRLQQTMLCLVDPNKVTVDPRFQRGHDEKHSSRMAQKNVPVVPYAICGYNDGVLDAIDGQHRVERAIKLDLNEMYVVVKMDMTLAEKAGTYADLNEAKRPDRWNTFNARLIAGDRDHVAMKAIANRHGLTLKCEGRDGDLRNTHTMVEAHNAGLYESWVKLLCCFQTDEGLEKRAAYNAIEFQRGLIDILRKYGAEFMTTPRIRNAIRQIGIALIMEAADQQCNCSRTNRSHYARAIDGLLQSRNLIPARLLAAA